jgi:hypothetical protein
MNDKLSLLFFVSLLIVANTYLASRPTTYCKWAVAVLPARYSMQHSYGGSRVRGTKGGSGSSCMNVACGARDSAAELLKGHVTVRT